jgi:hypothetical protein
MGCLFLRNKTSLPVFCGFSRSAKQDSEANNASERCEEHSDEAIQSKSISRIRQQTTSQFYYRARYLQDAISLHSVSIQQSQLTIMGNSLQTHRTQGLYFLCVCEAVKGRY